MENEVNIRWAINEDGTRVLQYTKRNFLTGNIEWFDVDTVNYKKSKQQS